MDSLFLGDKNTTYYIGASAMPSTLSSYLSSAPNTSELIAPSEIQQANDFDSTGTSASTETGSSGIHEPLVVALDP
jgi:hypothetical protein